MKNRRANSLVKGAEEARRELPALVSAAAQGHTTVITRHGRAIAAIVPADWVPQRLAQASIVPLSGSGKGLWGRRSAKIISTLRDEWNR